MPSPRSCDEAALSDINVKAHSKNVNFHGLMKPIDACTNARTNACMKNIFINIILRMDFTLMFYFTIRNHSH